MHEETDAAGLHSVYDGPWEFFVGGGGRRSIATARAFPRCSWRGAKIRARLYVNESKAGGPIKFEEKALDIGADPKPLTQCHRRLSARHRWRRPHGSLCPEGGRQPHTQRRPDCTLTLMNHEWNFDGNSGWTTSFAADRSGGRNSRPSRSATMSTAARPARLGAHARKIRSTARGPATRPTIPLRTPLVPGFCALSMLFTDWNKSGVPSLQVSNDRQYYRGGEEQMWRIEPGNPPRLYGRADGWRNLCSTAWASPRAPRRLRLSGILPHLDGRREAAEARSRRVGAAKRQSIATSPAKSA